MPQPINKRFDVSLDLCRSSSTREFTVVEGDTGTLIVIKLSDSGVPVALDDCFIQAVFLRPDGTSSTQNNDGHGITVTGDGELKIELYPSSVSPGIVECELQLFSGDDRTTLITSAKFNFSCRKAILDEDTVTSSPDFPVLVSLISDTKNLKKDLAQVIEDANDAVNECYDFLDNSASGYSQHISDSTKHITATERSEWNAKQDKLTAGDGITIDADNTISSSAVATSGKYAEAFLKQLSGNSIVIDDILQDSPLKNCRLLGSCTVTRTDESLPVSFTNKQIITPNVPSYIMLSYNYDESKYTLPEIALYGVESYTSDEYDAVTGTFKQYMMLISLDGTEGWTTVSSSDGYPDYYAAPLPYNTLAYAPFICSHLPSVDFEYGECVDASSNYKGLSIMNGELRFRPVDSTLSTLKEFVATLRATAEAGDPVSVCFQMAEPIYHNYTPVEIRSLADTSLQYIRTDTNTKLDIIYCCDMNAFMNKAPIGTFLKRTNLNELGFDWHSITATDVGAAKYKHDHGNISSSGAVGTQSNLPIFTGANGVIQTKSIDEARSLLNISDELDIGAFQQSLPILTRQTTAEVVTVSDINTDIGYMHIMLKGKLIASKPDPTAEISPSNIATISHVKPDMLYIDNLDGEELAKVDLSNTPVVWGIGEACDTVDIQTGSVISRINKLILKGTEQWNYTAADDGGAPFFTYTLSGSSMPAYEIANLMCTHFESVPYADRTIISSDNTLTGVSAGNGMLSFRPPTMETDFPSLTEWEAFLAEQYAANTPVTVYYETEFGYEAGGSSVTVPVPAENMRIYTDTAILLDVKYALNTKEFSGIAEDYNGTDKTVTSISDCFEYHFGTLNKLTVIPEALPQSHYSFSMYFNSGDNISVSLPSQIRWAGGTAPTFLANKTYELSVKDNLGKLEVYEIE